MVDSEVQEGDKKMRKLNTIQTKEKLNNVYAMDELGPGGANHHYLIVMNELDQVSKEESENGEHIPDQDVLAEIKLQKGPRKESDSQHGVIDSDLLEIVRDRLISFQSGPFSSTYNAEALEHVEKALEALNKRVEDRIARNVLGTNNK